MPTTSTLSAQCKSQEKQHATSHRCCPNRRITRPLKLPSAKLSNESSISVLLPSLPSARVKSSPHQTHKRNTPSNERVKKRERSGRSANRLPRLGARGTSNRARALSSTHIFFSAAYGTHAEQLFTHSESPPSLLRLPASPRGAKNTTLLFLFSKRKEKCPTQQTKHHTQHFRLRLRERTSSCCLFAESPLYPPPPPQHLHLFAWIMFRLLRGVNKRSRQPTHAETKIRREKRKNVGTHAFLARSIHITPR